MKILVTGGFGNVGRSTVTACLEAGHEVTIFERMDALKHSGRGLAALLKGRWKGCRIVTGDIRSASDLNRALALVPGGPDAVIHLAAILPPASDRNEALAWDINVEGTKALIDACLRQEKKPRFILASSIATYGDRIDDYWISASDPLCPSDLYSRSKVACEGALRGSGLDFTILRLSYVVWSKWFPFDPLLFSMPLATKIEIVHTQDAGRAFASAAASQTVAGLTLDIGGGSSCRTTFRVYLDRIFILFGLGNSDFLPDDAFARGNFHCGWYRDSDEAEKLLGFRRKSLEDFYEEVRWEERFVRPAARIASVFIRPWLLAKSPLLREERRDRAGNNRARLQLSKSEKR
ncbi:MAG: NAD(P)-dependent oxidoreductase [Spirochaetes bacterium]|nr:NAD(P)-dependent oxidoreductase [Spirochaetota bacterium]